MCAFGEPVANPTVPVPGLPFCVASNKPQGRWKPQNCCSGVDVTVLFNCNCSRASGGSCALCHSSCPRTVLLPPTSPHVQQAASEQSEQGCAQRLPGLSPCPSDWSHPSALRSAWVRAGARSPGHSVETAALSKWEVLRWLFWWKGKYIRIQYSFSVLLVNAVCF